jgi:signal peptidase
MAPVTDNTTKDVENTQSKSAQAPAEVKTPKKSAFRRIWGAFGTLMTFVAVIFGTLFVVAAVASRFSPPNQYTVFGHPVMSVLSGSMGPTIKTGDLIYDDAISNTEAAHLRVGQVISFRQGKDVFTHRIHAIEKVDGSTAYQTKGDANGAPDQPLVVPSQIVGLYQAKVPYGGYILNALHKPFTLVLLLASPLLWLLSGWLFALAREADRRDQVPAALAGSQEVAVM